MTEKSICYKYFVIVTALITRRNSLQKVHIQRSIYCRAINYAIETNEIETDEIEIAIETATETIDGFSFTSHYNN